jgi:hypothetical protein
MQGVTADYQIEVADPPESMDVESAAHGTCLSLFPTTASAVRVSNGAGEGLSTHPRILSSYHRRNKLALSVHSVILTCIQTTI